jgi:predicted  nucleic acid-binding Zn-ribbon protein
MAKKVEYSVEERLRALYDLQLIDSRIDKIRSVRGELPLEVEDLEDEVSGLSVRFEKIEAELEEFENGIKDKLNKIEESKALIKKYNDQQKNVRNNRAFESLSKEIEYQELEIEYSEKQINEIKAQIELKKEKLDETNSLKEERNSHLEHKKNELDSIMKETEKEENELLSKSEEFQSKIDDSLLVSYQKIRSSVKNGEVMTALLDRLRGILRSALEIALWAVALLTLLQVLFGDSFVLLFGIDVLGNIGALMAQFGSEGLVGLIAAGLVAYLISRR